MKTKSRHYQKDRKYYLTHKKGIASKRKKWYHKNRDKILAKKKAKPVFLDDLLLKERAFNYTE